MNDAAVSPASTGQGEIALELHDIGQLFHSLDPSPFRERDLDRDAEEFIVSWAREIHRAANLKLVIHLRQAPSGALDERAITDAVHNYFTYRADMFVLRDRELLREGFKNLVIGLTFLASCLFAARGLQALGNHALIDILRESLIIGGWVAMWRPMQIFLYDRWPLQRTRDLYRRLAGMPVILRIREPASAG